MKRDVGVPESEESNLIIYIMELGFAIISSKLNEELKWLTGIRLRRSKKNKWYLRGTQTEVQCMFIELSWLWIQTCSNLSVLMAGIQITSLMNTHAWGCGCLAKHLNAANSTVFLWRKLAGHDAAVVVVAPPPPDAVGVVTDISGQAVVSPPPLPRARIQIRPYMAYE